MFEYKGKEERESNFFCRSFDFAACSLATTNDRGAHGLFFGFVTSLSGPFLRIRIVYSTLCVSDTAEECNGRGRSMRAQMLMIISAAMLTIFCRFTVVCICAVIGHVH